MIDRTIRYRAVVHYERFYKSLRGVAQIYSVSKSSLQRWVTMKPSIRKPRRPKQILREIRDCIDAALAATPCMTVQQICSTVASKCSLRRSSTNTTRKWLKDLKYSRKKVYKTVEYTPSEGLTSEFINTYSYLRDTDIVCIDEAGFHVGDYGRYGYSKRGRRIHVASSRTVRKVKYSLILAIGPQGVLHYHILNGSCKKTNFVDFMNDLPAELVDQKTLVMDNIMFHHSVETLDAAKRKNCKILHIPPYSPRYNAIEYAFSILKRNYRSVCSEADLQTAVADDYLHALTASIEMCGSFEGLFRRVRQSVDAYRVDQTFQRYD